MHPSNPIHAVLETLQAILVASILAVALLASSSAWADDQPFYFDERGQVQQRDYSPSYSPSRSDRDAMNREILRQNEALVDEYYNSNRSNQQPSWTDPNPLFTVVPGVGERSKLCQRSFSTIYCH